MTLELSPKRACLPYDKKVWLFVEPVACEFELFQADQGVLPPLELRFPSELEKFLAFDVNL